jgi:hypothetical protein
MTTPQFFAIPDALLALAGDAVSRRVGRIPLERDGIPITLEIIGVAMESLNAEFSRTLAIAAPAAAPEKGASGSLEQALDARLGTGGPGRSRAIAQVLCDAGIAAKAEVLDRSARTRVQGIRLLPAWIWHYSAPIAQTPSPAKEDAAPGQQGWMNACPVCRTGLLNRVTGKQLFGIPHTDFYIDCTYCGAKFIPVGEMFRLVSIARIRDPAWKRWLNRTLPANQWETIARGAAASGKKGDAAAVSHPGNTTPGVTKEAARIARLKDGTIGLPCHGTVLYFRPAKLVFSGRIREDVFSRVQRPLRELVERPEYAHLGNTVMERYSRYLPLGSGTFLMELKMRHDPRYLSFLNPWGDLKYGTFSMDNHQDTEKRGVFVLVSGDAVLHAAACMTTFRETINRLGQVMPSDCLLDGDSAKCRINSTLSVPGSAAGIFLHATADEKEIARTLGALEKLQASSGKKVGE